MKIATFVLDTTADIFLEWLRDYIDRMRQCPWATDGKYLQYWEIGSEEFAWIGPIRRLFLYLTTPRPGFPPVGLQCETPRHIQSPRNSELEVKVIPLGTQRIEVTLHAMVLAWINAFECKVLPVSPDPVEHAACDFMDELIPDIIKRWPEAQSPASPALEKTPSLLEAYDEAYRLIVKREAHSLASRFWEDKAAPQEAPEEADDVVETEEAVPATESRRKRRQPKHIRKRREQVQILSKAGYTIPQIHQNLGKWSESTVKRDRKYLRRTGELD